MRLEGWHIVIIIVIAILLFGAPKLPGLARSVGQSLRIFKSEVRQMKDENTTAGTDGDPVEGRVVNNPGQAAPQQGPAAGHTPPSGPNTGSGNPPANP
ncbi:MAG: Sec-independent protein translocase subunit TatA [Arthrobacter sp.]